MAALRERGAESFSAAPHFSLASRTTHPPSCVHVEANEEGRSEDESECTAQPRQRSERDGDRDQRGQNSLFCRGPDRWAALQENKVIPARLVTARHCLARWGAVRRGVSWPCQASQGEVRCGRSGFLSHSLDSGIRHGMARSGQVGLGGVWHGVSRFGSARFGEAGRGRSGDGTVRSDVDGGAYGTSIDSRAKNGLVRPG